MTQKIELSSEWKITKLSDIASEFIGGGTPSTSKIDYWNGDIFWTTSKTISSIYLDKGERKITEKGLNESSTHLIPRYNLLIGTRVGVGKVTINKIDIAISQDLTGVIIDKQKYDLLFLAYQITTNDVQRCFNECMRGTTIKGIPRDDLKKIVLKLPPLTEQQKIAHVLSTIQEAAAKTENVINSLKELKKSMMKHLFTYGAVSLEDAETVELKDTEIGQIPKDWMIVKLGDYSRVVRGASPRPKGDRRYYYGNVPRLMVGDVTRDGKYVTPKIDFLTEEGAKLSRPMKKGSLVIQVSGNPGTPAILEVDACIHDGFSGLMDLNEQKVDIEFLYYFLVLFREENNKLAFGSIFKNLQTSIIRNILIPFPPLSEQKEIASILSSIDTKIESEENKKKALDELFKSMLHNLMTAKIRVIDLEV